MRVFVPFLLVSTLLAQQPSPEVATFRRKGEALVEAGQISQAEDLYESALRQFPANPDLERELGMVYFRQHDWAKAIENYRSSLDSSPKRVTTLFYLAEAYFMNADLDSALETIAEAASIAPNDSQICQKYGEYLSTTLDTRKQAVVWLEKARKLNSGLDQIDFEIGKAQFELTDFQPAIQNFEATLKKNPENGQAAFFLAESWGRLSDWENAKEQYTYALRHGYTTGAAYYGLGRALVQVEDFRASLSPLKSALAKEPSLIQVHFQLANAYRHLHRLEEADREQRLFAEMSNRTDTSNELNGPEEQRAWKHVKPLLDQDKEQPALDYLATLPDPDASGEARRYYLLGAMYFSMGKKHDAERVLLIAGKKAPQVSRIAAYLGIVQLSSGDARAAEQSFQSALALDSAEGLALIGMGSVSYQQQRWSDTIDFIEKSRTSDPGVLYMLCDAYFRTGQIANAFRVAEVTRAFASRRTEVLDALDQLVKLHRDTRDAMTTNR